MKFLNNLFFLLVGAVALYLFQTIFPEESIRGYTVKCSFTTGSQYKELAFGSGPFRVGFFPRDHPESESSLLNLTFNDVNGEAETFEICTGTTEDGFTCVTDSWDPIPLQFDIKPGSHALIRAKSSLSLRGAVVPNTDASSRSTIFGMPVNISIQKGGWVSRWPISREDCNY